MPCRILTASFSLLGCMAFLPAILFAQALVFGPVQKQKFGFIKEENQVFGFQDSRGFIWGTGNDWKPIRFDGFKIQAFSYDPQDSTSYSGCVLWPNYFEFLEDRTGKIWIKSSGNCVDRYNPATGRFEKISEQLTQKTKAKKSGDVRDIFEDSNGDVWIAEIWNLFKYSITSGKVNFFRVPDDGIKLVFEDKDGNIWVIIDSDFIEPYLVKLNQSTGKFENRITPVEPYPVPYASMVNRKDAAVSLGESGAFLMLIGFHLYLFEPEANKISMLNTPFQKGELPTFLYSKDKQVLVGTSDERIFQVEPTRLSFQPVLGMEAPKKNSQINDIFLGNDGALWFGKSDGTYKLPPKITNFQTVPIPYTVNNPLFAESILEWQGEVWFNNTPGLGQVRKWNLPAPPLKARMPSFENDETFIYEFDEDDEGNLWIAIFKKEGFDVASTYLRHFDKKGNQLREFSCRSTDENCFTGIDILSHLESDRRGGIWLATRTVLSHFDPKTGRFGEHLKIWTPANSAIGEGVILCLFVDSQNNLWIGKNEDSLRKLDNITGKWGHYSFTDLPGGRSENSVYAILEDSLGYFWLATGLGVVLLDSKTGDYKRYAEKELVPGNEVYKIFEDHHGKVWIATENFLALYNPETDHFIPYTAEDGVKISNWTGKVYHDNDHFFYLSTINNDLSYFHPDSFKINTTFPNIYFTDFQLTNATVRPGDSTAILKNSLDFTESITLKYAQNDFTIHYTAPEFIHPNETVFAIQLEGFNDDWQEVSTKREARYTNLSPGTYTFKVKVRNHHGFWSETPRTLQIVVLPPWYRTWWAWCIWVTMILGSAYWFYNFQLNRRLAEAEALRLKEMDAAKTRLYTNITHEFRTPLTVILGMAEQVKNDPKNWFNEGLQLIRRNGKQLLNLVNQLLDLSKLESGHMPLNLVQGDAINYLKYIVESFHSYADSKDIRLHFMTDLKEFQMDYDPEKLQHIVSNLLSNAIKFTPAGGDVYFQLLVERQGEAFRNLEDFGNLVLVVKDNGIGIPLEHLPHVFDRFYQAGATHTRRGEGTGIGLALTKELVKLMGGNIEVESEVGNGTKFTLHLPIHKTAEKTQPSIPNESPSPLAGTLVLGDEKTSGGVNVPPGDRHLVLLIEDNQDVTTYLASFLSSDYRIITASNGQEGIEKAIETIPDLVVSDVMMPGKDGFEVCQTLKTDERTSHIPVILLTAKADLSSKIEGLKHGADAYLAKPFNKEELLVRLEKLIELRQQMQGRYGRNDIFLKNVISHPKSKPPSLDELFLQKVIGVIEKNLSDEDFGLPELCRQLHMSRSQVFRKLKALTGKSTTNFIRSIRLAKAKVLLETTSLPVSEVGYETGFGNPAYFSRMFQEEFGMPPSGVRNERQK